jgi:DNA polymerase I-like protein with 3'-5' exonuclease and polymerase domains
MAIYAFDIESNGLHETIKGKKELQKEFNTIWCLSTVNVETGEALLFERDNIPIGIDMLEKADLIVGHNIYGFDIPALERMYGFKPGRPFFDVIDTLLLSRMLYGDEPPTPDQGHSLKSWGLFLGNNKGDYDKGWDEYNKEMGDYCIQDSRVTKDLYHYLMKQVDKIGLSESAIRLEHTVAKIIKEQVENGFAFDIDHASRLTEELQYEICKIEDDMQKIFPPIVTARYSEKTGKKLKDGVEIFNPSSRQQIARRLGDKYGWEPTETEKGNPKVDYEVLSKLDYPEAQVLCEYFDKDKLKSQVMDWIARAVMSRDGRIHGLVNTLGTVTGRMSAREPNLQNVHSDPRARACFVASPGKVIVGADLKGLELRMLAHYLHPYDNGVYVNEVTKGDVHIHNQKAMGVATRDMAKTGIYCFLYGGGDAKFAKTIKTTEHTAKKVKSNLTSNIVGLQKIIDICRFDSTKHGFVKPFDWRPVFVRKQHAALNTLLQSSGAHIAKVWLCVADANLKSSGLYYKWLVNVHDEVQAEADPEHADQVGRIICEAATKAGEILKCNCPIEAEYKIGKNWSETH